jgi:hypothetical protein
LNEQSLSPPDKQGLVDELVIQRWGASVNYGWPAFFVACPFQGLHPPRPSCARSGTWTIRSRRFAIA